VAGVRVEHFRQEVNTFDPFGLFEQREQALLENTDVFPGVNFVYALRSNASLRLGVSQTVNRPEFRELAAFEFTDVVGNRAVRGNPGLVRTLIQNVDARVEAFTGGRGVLAASVFFKNFNDPIERVINAGAQPLQTYENASGARNLGVELEAGRQIIPHLFVSANYTFGNRIADVGANQAPDIVEQGRGTVDIVLQQRLARLAFRLGVDNVTDAAYLFTQGDQDQRRFQLGRTFTFSLGYSFF
jgi:outer membrane receptor protein involved in Fe transport